MFIGFDQRLTELLVIKLLLWLKNEGQPLMWSKQQDWQEVRNYHGMAGLFFA